MGATLVAITPQTVARSRSQVDKHPLDYDVLTDAENRYAEALGIRYQLPADLAALYGQFGLDLPSFHESTDWVLPIPARIVVDQAGIVQFSEANPDYTRRPEPAETLAVLRAIVR